MRIRRSTISPISQSPPTPSSCSSSSSCFSSSTTHSTISTHSLISSSNSTSSSHSSLSLSSNRRCQGLDLLVKAVYYVAGSVVGVPYIQKRVIRRRKPALTFTNLVINSDEFEVHLDDQDVDCNLVVQKNKIKKKGNLNKQKKRSKAIPLKYHDSVLQSLKPKDRPRRRSTKS
ncbi:unnamed protein product [Amaranthus hypochondriacus]